MTTISHASLTGSDLHEPKGAASAASGTVYVANGSGSGTWTTLAALSDTVGKIEMFCTPRIPTGYLECSGASVSRTTYADLFDAVTVQQTGTRTNGSASITGLSSTNDIKAGYFVGGTGITNGTTVLSVDSGTAITMSANATSTGSSTVIASPWALGNGTTTFTLPDMTTTGRYPRSRIASGSVIPGQYQANQNKTHTHTFTTDTDGGGASMVSSTESATHTHTGVSSSNTFLQLGATSLFTVSGTTPTGSESATHTHTTTLANHQHAGTTASSGSSEARPESIGFFFCVKY